MVPTEITITNTTLNAQYVGEPGLDLTVDSVALTVGTSSFLSILSIDKNSAPVVLPAVLAGGESLVVTVGANAATMPPEVSIEGMLRITSDSGGNAGTVNNHPCTPSIAPGIPPT